MSTRDQSPAEKGNGAPLSRPATFGITRDGLTVWKDGQSVLHVPREALPGIALRCLAAWHEG